MKGDDAFEGVRPLTPGQWKVNPSTGVLSLTEEVLQKLINPEPIETWYTLDPEPIARGQFAVVYHCHHRITGEEFAAKFSSRWRLGSDCTVDLVHEIAVCAVLRPNSRAVQLVDVFSNDRELILVMEYAPGGDLQTLLDENLVPYERDVIKFMRQLLEGLAFIHDRNIVHLDIKPQNLVLMGEFPDCAIKLCDFEISRMLTPGQEVREILGTPDYVAPEILHYEPITTRTDMWSVGVLTYVLLTGFLPFGGENDQETFVEILKCDVDFPSELFEDITPEAIDFISKLLIRQPEQRMNAQECLNHSWIKQDVKISIERPTTLNLKCNLNSPMPIIPISTPISVIPEISGQTMNSNIVKELPKQNVLTKTLSDGPRTQQYASSRDIGRPPLHPSSSQKSLFCETPSIAGTPVMTPGSYLVSPFIYRQESKFGSRHNLDRLRSLSKSREVLSERIQMSNLKKSMSKSREKLGMTKSREQLLALSSFSQFSQSVEALSALSHFRQQNNALYQSCCNIFAPKVQLPQNTNNGQERMYQSLAAIDQIDKMNYSKKGYFESRMSLNDNDYSNDVITQRNTDMNCFVGDMKFDKTPENKNPLGLRANTCKGGRGGDSCDNRCARHRQAESKLTQKITKISRSEKLKRDAQKRRKEKKEKERVERLKREKESRERERQKAVAATESELQKGKSFDKSPQDGSSSPSFRRGSVCHVEQRIQERHERNQERLERQEKEDRKHKKRSSVELDRSNSTEKPKPKLQSLGVNNSDRPRSITPTRRRKIKKKSSPQGSDVSQASSLESVDVTEESHTLDVKNLQDSEPKVLPHSEDLENNNTLISEENVEADEAYVSLEEPSRDCMQRADSNSSDETDKTVTEIQEETKLSSDEELGVETLSVSDKILGFEKGLISSLQKHPSILSKQKSFSEAISGDIKDLFIINEESSSSENLNEITGTSFQRSISNTSDFGSQMSESSEGSLDREEIPRSLKIFTDKKDLLSPDWKARSRSFSVHVSPSPPPIPKGRSRSNSFNFDGNDCSIARPWGNVCSGSVARAFEKFNLKFIERTRKSSALLLSPSEEQLPSFD